MYAYREYLKHNSCLVDYCSWEFKHVDCELSETSLQNINKYYRSIIVQINNWASEASPTLGCSIEISRDM